VDTEIGVVDSEIAVVDAEIVMSVGQFDVGFDPAVCAIRIRSKTTPTSLATAPLLLSVDSRVL
jgi:hypothetical protein